MDENLQDLNINFRQATNYLITLFYKTEQRYSTGRTKIGKLMSIVAFVYARWGQRLFVDEIYKYDDCGTIIASLDFISREVYVTWGASDDDKQYIHDDLCIDCNIPNYYSNCVDVPEDVKFVIEDVFRNFGAYSQGDLGNCLNLIVDLDYMVDNKKLIRLEKIQELDFKDFKDLKDNEVIKYLTI